ncbi:MAG TPA: sialate O-acetylesterase [Bacteroidia bacterium]|nr:sialate O-acetylesterase [Bacteroidia bacterium]
MRLFLTILSFVSFNLFAQLPLVRVYILAGQSNMSGTQNPLVSQLPESLKDTLPNVLIKVGGDNVYNWQALRPGLGSQPVNFGPEITFGHDAATYFKGDKIALIKYAYGGTTLNEDWRPPSSGGKTGWLYNGFVNDLSKYLDTLAKNYTVQLMGMCWMQGEYDARDNAVALNYQSNLSNFIKDVRATLNAPQLPFAIGMIDNSYPWQFNSIVRQAEINVAKNTEAVSVFDTHGLGTDATHYNTLGQIELGHFFFNSVNNLFSVWQAASNGGVKVFPNPTNHSFEVAYTDVPADYSYKITDKKGAEVQSGQLYSGYQIDVSLLSPGTYFITLTINGTNSTVKKKLVKI